VGKKMIVVERLFDHTEIINMPYAGCISFWRKASLKLPFVERSISWKIANGFWTFLCILFCQKPDMKMRLFLEGRGKTNSLI